MGITLVTSRALGSTLPLAQANSLLRLPIGDAGSAAPAGKERTPVVAARSWFDKGPHE